jgi:hypothetical protein
MDFEPHRHPQLPENPALRSPTPEATGVHPQKVVVNGLVSSIPRGTGTLGKRVRLAALTPRLPRGCDGAMLGSSRSLAMVVGLVIAGLGVVRGQSGLVLFGLAVLAGGWLFVGSSRPPQVVAPPVAAPPSMPEEYPATVTYRKTRCTETGLVVSDPRQDGDGCPKHTELHENGGGFTAEELRDADENRRETYPHGRYCCDHCKWVRDPVSES